MITIRLGGGLGNQMFQYAFGRSLANERGEELRLDVSDYMANTVAGAHTRLYGLSNFNIVAGTVPIEEARRLRTRESSLTKRILRRIESSILGRNRIKFEPFITRSGRDPYIEGYWQSYKYFPEMREALLREFSLKTPLSPGATAIAESIRNSLHAVSVHVRRGDYAESAEARRHYGECGQSYYLQAVAEISKRRQQPLTLFVFSDDIGWVKQNLSFPANTQYVAEDSAPDYERLILMSLCHNHIIANSTFSWWGAWLNPKSDKVVVGPTPWIPGIDLPADDILPPVDTSTSTKAMKPTLSIIMPCFDCAQTLREAVESCYTQGLESFELIMVDDRSTDSTLALMEKLSAEHDNIRTFKNDRNLGGGATRNRAVAEAKSDTIFCLDSDDILPPNTLSRMLAYLKEHALDGLGFEHCVKFIGTDISNIDRVDTFDFSGAEVPLASLLEKKNGVSCPLYINFMYTRKAFDLMGGYPEHHGFDTQGFAWRFLLNGLRAHGCPGSSYLQRIKFKRSYYLREYESGKANRNWFEIFSEFLWAFDPMAQEVILRYDVHDPFSGIFDDTRKLPRVFASPLPQPPKTKEDGVTAPRLWWIAHSLFRQGKYNDAKIILKELEALGLPYPSIPRLIEGCELGTKGLSMPEIRSALDTREKFEHRGSILPFHKKILRRVRKLIRIIRNKI